VIFESYFDRPFLLLLAHLLSRYVEQEMVKGPSTQR